MAPVGSARLQADRPHLPRTGCEPAQSATTQADPTTRTMKANCLVGAQPGDCRDLRLLKRQRGCAHGGFAVEHELNSEGTTKSTAPVLAVPAAHRLALLNGRSAVASPLVQSA